MNSLIKSGIEKLQNKLIFTNEGITNPETIKTKDLKSLDKISIKIFKNEDNELIFDIIGIDASIANALRRIMIAEIPTMAIEKVFLYQNTSLIPDEVLAHRLGLIPIKADPSKFIEKHHDEEYNEKNCIKFGLKMKCERRPEYKQADKKILEEALIEQVYTNTTVYSKDLEWIPIGNQKKTFENNPLRPVFDDIIINKLRENQEIEAELYCEKGIGKTHAKWSPVATSYYRLMPDIKFKKPIHNKQAEKLKEVCPLKVFDIEEIGNHLEAIVKNPRDCTMCRECIRDEEFNDAIELGKESDHYIFTIESVGILNSKDIFKEAIQILKEKSNTYTLNFE